MEFTDKSNVINIISIYCKTYCNDFVFVIDNWHLQLTFFILNSTIYCIAFEHFYSDKKNMQNSIKNLSETVFSIFIWFDVNDLWTFPMINSALFFSTNVQTCGKINSIKCNDNNRIANSKGASWFKFISLLSGVTSEHWMNVIYKWCFFLSFRMKISLHLNHKYLCNGKYISIIIFD